MENSTKLYANSEMLYSRYFTEAGRMRVDELIQQLLNGSDISTQRQALQSLRDLLYLPVERMAKYHYKHAVLSLDNRGIILNASQKDRLLCMLQSKTAELIEETTGCIGSSNVRSNRLLIQDISSRMNQYRKRMVEEFASEPVEEQLTRKKIKNLEESKGPNSVETAEGYSHVDRLLKGLSKRERTVLKMRHGLTDGIEYTLEEVGEVFKISRERVRQIESEALNRLKNINIKQSGDSDAGSVTR